MLSHLDGVTRCRLRSTPKLIRSRVREQLPANSVVVAHSLGSVIAFDILREDVEQGKYSSADRNNWPFHSLITFGSPLNLKMFFRDNESNRDKKFSKDFGAWFYWYNFSGKANKISAHIKCGTPDEPGCVSFTISDFKCEQSSDD
jgi:hypothetical protein